MIHLRVNQKKTEPTLIKLIADSLRQGRVVVLPTDTIYGLSCLADDERAIKKNRRLKKRETGKPLAVLVASRAMLKKYVFVSSHQEKILKKIWGEDSRPTTVILKHRDRLPKILTGNSEGLAARLPKNDFLLKILKAVGKPIVSTSLNLSGQPTLKDLKGLKKYFLDKNVQPDLIIDSGRSRRNRPSRVLDLREEKPAVLRK